MYESTLRRNMGFATLPVFHAMAAGLSFAAHVGCSIGKLFPLQYWCETYICSVTSHIAILSFVQNFFDVIERGCFLRILRLPNMPTRLGSTDDQCGCWLSQAFLSNTSVRVVPKLLIFAINICWVMQDLFGAVVAAPGQGTLALGVLSCIGHFIVLGLDLWVMVVQFNNDPFFNKNCSRWAVPPNDQVCYYQAYLPFKSQKRKTAACALTRPRAGGLPAFP